MDDAYYLVYDKEKSRCGIYIWDFDTVRDIDPEKEAEMEIAVIFWDKPKLEEAQKIRDETFQVNIQKFKEFVSKMGTMLWEQESVINDRIKDMAYN